MTIGRFLAGLIFTLFVVAIWSWQQEATAGTIALRLIAAAVIVQLGYVAGVFMMARREARQDQAGTAVEPERTVPPTAASHSHSHRTSLDT